MRVIPFPGGGSESPDETWLTELEAALNGDVEGVVADSWRALREDVRALAPPMDPEFEREIGERIAERRARSAPKQPYRPKQPHRRLGWLHRPTRPALGAIAAAVSVLLVALVITGPWRSAPYRRGINAGRATETRVLPSVSAKGASKNASPGETGASGSASAGVAASAPAAASNAPAFSGVAASGVAASGVAAPPGRVQQLGASISLSAIPSEVQTVADRVSQLAVSDGGYVQSSHVNEEEKAGEANLTLSLPSAKLSGALASLGQLAPVRAESQSLQDITNTYDAARQRVADATAERQSLLRALSKATTEGQIDSLRERLSQNRGAIALAQSAFQAVSQHASTAEVEVTVLGDAHAGSEGLTLHRGLHDAGRVLVVTLVVLLIAAAILVPLALLLLALLTARRAWRRYQRERVLDAPIA